MKRVLICLLLVLALCAGACAEGRPILYTVYRQMGWGDAFQAGFVDEDGGLWMLKGSASDMDWPFKLEDQLEYLAHADGLQSLGALDYDALFDLKSLVYSVEAQPVQPQGVANDAGTEISYALNYTKDGGMEVVRLGMSGDDVYENTDPNAQALYLMLRRLFPGVNCFGDGMGPAGFQPVPVADFLGIDRDAIRDAQVRACIMDCEEGPIPTECDADTAREIVLNGTVTGKANASEISGGMTDIAFYDADDKWIAGYQIYNGLLVRGDGMYTIE